MKLQEMKGARGARTASILAAFLVLTLIWGTTWGAIRVSLEGIPPLTGVAVRFGVASLALLAVARLQGARLGALRFEKRLWLVNAGCAFAIPYSLIYWAELRIPSGLVAVIFATYPIFVTLIAQAALPGERLGARGAVGTMLGFLGIAVIFSEDLARIAGPGAAPAAVAALIAPCVAAFGSVAVKRWGGGVHALSLTAIPMGLTALVIGALALTTERGADYVLNARTLGALAYLSLAGTAVAFVLYYWLLARIRATRLALIAYTAPIVAVVVGVTWLDESLTPRILVGATLVLAGVSAAGSRMRSRSLRADRE